MAVFVQPNADLFCLKGYEFFRLNQELASPGDIFESSQSGRVFMIGPESDIANVAMAYFDDQRSPTFISQMTLSPERPWASRVDARNETTYQPGNRPGRILFYSADLYDPTYVPAAFGAGNTLTMIRPRIDVVEYFQDIVPTVGRSDKSYEFQELPLPANSAFIVIPYYGRKMASIRLQNRTSGDVDYSIFGVNFFINDGTLATETQIVGTTTIGTGAQASKVVKEGVDGSFHALYVAVHADTPDGPTPLYITVSDTPVG